MDLGTWWALIAVALLLAGLGLTRAALRSRSGVAPVVGLALVGLLVAGIGAALLVFLYALDR
ncbi:hypothetical protein [Lacticaseibacillus daqingensis]|uniref:hypothetical protein n=1 Tax=Lacticaseibacillus daqingensis TaxID=2486014 RepID=UPI0013DD8969|nr:hypothetical protein [Lacticaseibacillus daqingensis]